MKVTSKYYVQFTVYVVVCVCNIMNHNIRLKSYFAIG